MRERAQSSERPGPFLDRREWLAAAIAAAAPVALGRAVLADAKESSSESVEAQEVAQVTAQAALGGLTGLRTHRSPNYLAIGDAPAAFIRLTLKDCERVALDFFEHYQAKGFAVSRPSGRLTIVVLADDRAFSAYLRKNVGPSTGGVFEKKSNRLIVYDYRAVGPQTPLRAGHASLMSLAHEATHQLSFNSGLLDRRADVPTAIVEGLAMYGENRKLDARTAPGQLNSIRLDDLARLQRRGIPWIPVSDLLEKDSAVRGFDGNERRLLAYAESWLLIYFLMKDPARLGGFRNYLKALRGRRTSEQRLEDARTHLGDLDQLNGELRDASIRMLRKR